MKIYKGVPESPNWQHVGKVLVQTLDYEGKPIIGHPAKYLEVHPSEESTGFAWGYGGQGPSALAVAMLIDALGEGSETWVHEGGRYHKFKDEFIATLAHGPWTIEEPAVRFWAMDNGWEPKCAFSDCEEAAVSTWQGRGHCEKHRPYQDSVPGDYDRDVY